MKKIFLLIAFSLCVLKVFAQTPTSQLPLTIEGGKFNFVIDEGFTFAHVTRVETQTNRSNFVRETMMAGAFASFRTVNLSKLDFIEQVSVFYCFRDTFNGMRQYPSNMFNFAVDSFTGITKRYNRFDIVKANAAIGLHYMFQMTDAWPMSYVGIGLQGGLELPITKGITILNNYFLSFDNANIGPNKLMQPFAISYQYHIDLGIRYSKRCPNSYCYIETKSL